jgi:hypothetical protein
MISSSVIKMYVYSVDFLRTTLFDTFRFFYGSLSGLQEKIYAFRDFNLKTLADIL